MSQFRVFVPGLFYEIFERYDTAVTAARSQQRVYPDRTITMEEREIGPWTEVGIPYPIEEEHDADQ